MLGEDDRHLDSRVSVLLQPASSPSDSKGAVVGRNGFAGNDAAYAAMGLSAQSPAEPEAVTKWRSADAYMAVALPF